MKTKSMSAYSRCLQLPLCRRVWTLKCGISLLMVLLCSLLPAGAQPDRVFENANWISTRMDDGKPNQWVCFRKNFVCLATDSSVKMHIAADSKYWLWVNGQLVVFEGGLKRGPNPQDTYYDSVEIGPFLRRGENILAVLVWYWGKDGFCHKNSGKCGLIAAVGNGSQAVVSDSSWRAIVHPAFGETGEPHPNFRLPESNVRYDGRLAMEGWQRADYDDSRWESALELGSYPCAPWNALHPRPFRNWRDSGIVGYERVEKETRGDTLYVRGILPRNITVTPYLKVRAQAGKCIDMRSDNYKGGSEYNVRAEYITRDGLQEFEAPNYVNGHQIVYTCPPGVKVIRVGYRETAFDTRHLGRFRCSDSFYNRLWEKALNTMNLNMRDAIQDADRERSQWWGDATIVLGEILYSCDNEGVKLIKKAIDNLVDWQKPDGVLFSPVPAGSWSSELPLQMLASIGKFGFWNYYYYTGDRATLQHAYPAVQRYLALWELDENDLVIHRAGGWDWPDWGANSDVPVLDNAWYCLALEAASEMARLLGDEAYATHSESVRRRVVAASRKTFWDGEYFRSPQHKGRPDDRAQGMAVLAGLASAEQAAQTARYLTEPHDASPYMEKYILESFFVRNDIQGGLDRMKKRYTNMVESPLTTLWEDWEIGGAGGGSINHGWAGGPLTLLSQYVAGISPLGAGWEKILVRPQLGTLEWVECDVPVFGQVLKMKAQKTGMGMRINIQNQTGRPCLVAIPSDAVKLRLNGKNCPPGSLKRVGGSLNGTSDGVQVIESSDRKIIVEYIL